MRPKHILLALLALCIVGCTTVKVQRVAPAHRPQVVYIQRNSAVEIDDFVGVLQDAFARHGITTRVVTTEPIPESAYVLNYTAVDGWDMASYLEHAELRLTQGTRIVGTALYKHSGGFGLNKYASNKTKMNPVVDELLSDVSPRRDGYTTVHQN